MQDGYIVLTNNPLVFEKLHSTHELIYREVSYEDILKEARRYDPSGTSAPDPSLVRQCEAK